MAATRKKAPKRKTVTTKVAPLVAITGTTKIAGKARAFSASVHPPTRDAHTGDYACRVQISLRRPIDTRIAGATAKQARELALAFVQSLLPQAIFP